MTDEFSTSENIDILLLLEGTYPYVTGGVSSWVHQLIKRFPAYKFGIIFLGGVKTDYKGMRYDIPSNVVHFKTYYLFDLKQLHLNKYAKLTEVKQHNLASMHESFTNYCPADYGKIQRDIHEQLFSKRGITYSDFIESELSWDYTLAKYQEKCPSISFLDYFWSVRNMHVPLWELIDIAKSVPPAKILHCMSTGYAGFLGALIHFEKNTPFIISEHGIYVKERAIDLLGQWCLSGGLEERELLTQDYLTNMWIKYFSIFAKISYSAAMIIVSLFADYQKRQISDGAPLEKTRIVPNCVKFPKEIIAKNSPSMTAPIIASIGRVVPIKDIKTFIRAMLIVVQHIPDAVGWIVGPADEDVTYAKECQELVTVLQLDQHIIFKGIQTVNDIFPQIDLVAISSISEGLPLIIIEAFAAGVPIVSTDVGACRELIYGSSPEDKRLGAAGEIVEIANAKALADTILSFVTDPDKWKKAQQIGRERVKQFYHEDKFIEQYRHIYDEAMTTWQELVSS